ncbi:GNAT family N-acetyltransferase [Actinotalea sp.]|uniref:GNAT family N-acetyltransferase n=1 Tax=Actinotalea sp. TaxID=1872145 RepID=UPI003567D212
MALFHDQADVSVRPAIPGDESMVAATQLRAWRVGLGSLVPDLMDRIDAPAVTAQWAAAITDPPSAGHRLLVALDGARIVGLAALVPVDGGVEITALEVDPDHRRGGHGSRLLAACVDLGRQGGAGHVQTWSLEQDEARNQFLGSAGLGHEGISRTLVSEEGSAVTLVEQRWFAQI